MEENIIKSAREIGLQKAEEIAKNVSSEALTEKEFIEKGKLLAYSYINETIDLKTLASEINKNNNELLLRGALLTLVKTIALDKDFSAIAAAVLELEKNNKNSNFEKYSAMELLLNSDLKTLQMQFNEIKKQKYSEFKRALEEQINLNKEAINAKLGAAPDSKIDIEKSIEISLENNKEWKDFNASLRLDFEEQIDICKNNLTELISLSLK